MTTPLSGARAQTKPTYDDLLEQTLADYARQVELREEELRLSVFFDRLNAIDSIPISMARWELTGSRD